MIQYWKSIGQIFTIDNSNQYLITHASNPLAIHLYSDVFRIFYSGRDVHNKSSVGFVDIDIVSGYIVNYPKEPVFIFGNDSSFFSHGVSIGNKYEVGENSYILFMGWQVEDGQHWRGDIGRLLLKDSTLKATSCFPFLSVDEEDKVSLSYPWVIKHDNIFKMWYGSTISWSSENDEMIHVIKYATSVDGENWIRHGIAIPFELGVAQAFSRPCVIVNSLGFHMWYSYRSGTGEKYRIGYSFSKDGLIWERKHEDFHFSVSTNGWDSEMICYPFVFGHKDKLYMLYNGNSYGKYGFGMSVLDN